MRKGRSRRWLLAPWVLGVFPAGLQAEEGKLAVSAKFANIGPGVDVTYGLSPQLHTRLTVHYAPTEELTHNDDIKAVGSWLLDWHPRGSEFRLSAGLSVIRERLGGSFSRDGHFTYSGESTELGHYLGVGWGNALARGRRWGFSFDLGGFGSGGFASSHSTTDGERVRVLTDWRLVVATGVSYRF